MNSLADKLLGLNSKSQPQPAPLQKKVEKPKSDGPKPKPNIGWLFYKDYFNILTSDDYQIISLSKEEKKQKKLELEIVEKKIDNKLQEIIKQLLPKAPDFPHLGNISFSLKTTYPGLLVGSGNTHELPDIKGQAILGFHFDYTSGLPIISGSSIKGVIKSAFRYPEYIRDIVGDNNLDVEALKKEIFDFGDIFFDAIVIKGNPQNKILGDDFITPHKEPTKEPVPLRFIKVLPEVTFHFDFLIQKSEVITKDGKQELFKTILLDLGLGAKTNVGYGKFTEGK